VAFSTPEVSVDEARIKVKVNITNSTATDANVTLKVNLINDRLK